MKLEKEVVKQVNAILKKKHLKIVLSSKYVPAHIEDKICIVLTRQVGSMYRSNVCYGWDTIENLLFKNPYYDSMFDINKNIQSEIDAYVDESITELGLKSLDDCNSYEEMLVRLAILKGSER